MNANYRENAFSSCNKLENIFLFKKKAAISSLLCAAALDLRQGRGLAPQRTRYAC
jgi:hypothetical protein